ncbi:unnamed protein product, partial [Ectocarpus sp. 8 AP-2014]
RLHPTAYFRAGTKWVLKEDGLDTSRGLLYPVSEIWQGVNMADTRRVPCLSSDRSPSQNLPCGHKLATGKRVEYRNSRRDGTVYDRFFICFFFGVFIAPRCHLSPGVCHRGWVFV